MRCVKAMGAWALSRSRQPRIERRGLAIDGAVRTGLIVLAVLSASCGAAKPAVPLAQAPEMQPVRSGLAAGPPRVELLSPSPGAVVSSQVVIETVVHNIALAPLGEVKEGFGHLHIVLGGSCVPPGEVISTDHLHFGDGSSDLELKLPPGPHELCVQLGDGFHTALAVTETLSIVVR